MKLHRNMHTSYTWIIIEARVSVTENLQPILTLTDPTIGSSGSGALQCQNVFHKIELVTAPLIIFIADKAKLLCAQHCKALSPEITKPSSLGAKL